MRKTTIVAFSVLAGLLLFFHRWITVEVLETVLDWGAGPLFADTLQLTEAVWKPGPGVRLKGLRGKLQTPQGPVPLEIRSVDSQGSLFDFFSKGGLRLDFERLRPKGSLREGILGTVFVGGGRNGFFELRAEVASVDLEDLVWLNPESLQGSRGEIKGEIAIRQGAGRGVRIRGRFRVEEPGGRLPASFFEWIQPSLPAAVVRSKIKEIQAAGGLVSFRVAQLEIEMTDPDRMKVFLQMAVPDYNLDLHLNMAVRFRE